MVATLLELGADVNRDDGDPEVRYTPLHSAVANEVSPYALCLFCTEVFCSLQTVVFGMERLSISCTCSRWFFVLLMFNFFVNVTFILRYIAEIIWYGVDPILVHVMIFRHVLWSFLRT